MIGVGKDEGYANFLELGRRDRLDRGLGADRCEKRCEQVTVWGMK